MEILIWINTLALLAMAIITVINIRQIQADHRLIAEALKQSGETLSRVERISLATLERIAGDTSRS
ncbi:MAG TPA: hypothetical protein VNO43_07415 [Candidatus Eisenbacteria bacterium]|nr:hypothetical protein [Candidatus Eisenbacteria bacterium]